MEAHGVAEPGYPLSMLRVEHEIGELPGRLDKVSLVVDPHAVGVIAGVLGLDGELGKHHAYSVEELAGRLVDRCAVQERMGHTACITLGCFMFSNPPSMSHTPACRPAPNRRTRRRRPAAG